MAKLRILFAAGAVLLAGCGSKEPLQPPPGASLPPTPALAQTPLTSVELLTPPPIARPDRVDELLRRSEARTVDRFDLPPGDVATGALPVPEAETEDDPE